MMKENVLKEKSFAFAIRVVNLYKFLCKEKNEFVLSKQVLRAGTSVGAMVRESEHAESKSDFIHKLAIAQKEINNSLSRLNFFFKPNFFSFANLEALKKKGLKIIKLITASIKTAKGKTNH